MITDEDIAQAEKQEKVLVEAYLKGITDFVKWSSTLAIAAILWVGDNITSIAGLSWAWRLSIVSLLFLVGSLVIAVLMVSLVLKAWAAEWVVTSEDYSFVVLKKLKAIEPSKVTKQKEVEQVNRLLDAIDATRPFSQPARFNTWLSWHIVFLIAGLFIYALAQTLSTL